MIRHNVAPYVGAWIETRHNLSSHVLLRVAPYVGAWIETCDPSLYTLENMSHPMWVRGLKPYRTIDWQDTAMSHPMWVRGLKL